MRKNNVELALKLIKEKGYTLETFPEDEWFSLNEYCDLNLYMDDLTGNCRATLFPVSNGQTRTDLWYDIPNPLD